MTQEIIVEMVFVPTFIFCDFCGRDKNCKYFLSKQMVGCASCWKTLTTLPCNILN